MKHIALIFLLLLTTTIVLASKDACTDPLASKKASQIAKTFKLNAKKELEVCKTLTQVNKRYNDIPVGHSEYKKLLSYVNQERLDMMNVVLGNAKDFKEYQRIYNPEEEGYMLGLIAISNEYVQKNGNWTPSKNDTDISLNTEATEAEVTN